MATFLSWDDKAATKSNQTMNFDQVKQILTKQIEDNQPAPVSRATQDIIQIPSTKQSTYGNTSTTKQHLTRALTHHRIPTGNSRLSMFKQTKEIRKTQISEVRRTKEVAKALNDHYLSGEREKDIKALQMANRDVIMIAKKFQIQKQTLTVE